MNAGRILVVEDQATWQRELSKLLRAVSVQVDVVSDATQAWLSVQSHEYELIIIDLSLVARVQHESVVPNKEGAALLARVRKSEGGDRIAVAIITGYPTAPAEIRDAFTEYDVDDFIEKKPWDPERFVARVRRAVVRARIRSARHASLRRQRATIIATPTRIISCELWGPQRGSFVLDPGVPLSTSDLGSRADGINALVLANRQEWRRDARKLGGELYSALIAHPDVAQALFSVAQNSTLSNPALLEIAGPAELLRVPFELATSGKDYVCFEAMITRRIAVSGLASAQNEAFFELINRIIKVDHALNVLLVGVNSDGRIPAVEMEVDELKKGITRLLSAVGIPHSIEILAGSRATYRNIRERVASGRLHILHFAGHGRFDEKLPEISGIIVGAGTSAKLLSAADLKQLFAGSGIRLAFFSCCVGARTAQQVGRGDFHGTLDAVIRGDIPVAVGYRWVIPDQPARVFALKFYEELLMTLSPGTAMLRARIAASTDSSGRDNSLWAAPIMVSQIQP